MINVLKNKDGYICAYIEWDMIDEEHMLIKHMWFHESLRSDYTMNGTMTNLIKLMKKDEQTHNTQFVGWERENHKLRWYPTYKILRRIYHG